MKGPVLSRRLSSVDAAFLYLERKEIPLHMASLSTFEDAIPFDEFVAHVESRLDLVPRYRQIAVTPPLNLGHPTWEHDQEFDIRRHIFRVRVAPPGGQAELEALAGRILSVLMDRSKPLWDIHVVEGLQGGRSALISRLHHSMADGISGVGIMNTILDFTPQHATVSKPHRYRPPQPRSSQELLAEAVGNATYSMLENLIELESSVLDLAQSLLGGPTLGGLQDVLKLLPEFAGSIERLPFNRPCTGDRKFCGTEISFEELRAVRQAVGGTVNDVVLTVLTRAISQYVKLHGQGVSNRFLRVVCPVNVRRDAQRELLGNRVSFLPVALPMGIRDPLELLRAVSYRTEIMKNARLADLVSILGAWVGATPPAVQAALWWGIPLVPLPVPLLNIICTNVPGPQMPLYALGRRMLTYYPQVPTGYELGVGCAVETYDGKMFWGLTADAHAAPDVERLRDLVPKSFAELCRAAGVKVAPRRTRAVRARRIPKTESPSAVSAQEPAPQPAPQAAPVGMGTAAGT